MENVLSLEMCIYNALPWHAVLAFSSHGNTAGGFPQSNSRQQGTYQNPPANWSGNSRHAPQVE